MDKLLKANAGNVAAVIVEPVAANMGVVPPEEGFLEGIHIKKDIPEELAEATKEYPGVKVTMGKTLGADKRLAEILIDRIND